MLVGAPLKRSDARHHVGEHLEELAQLADTAGAVVVGEMVQNIDKPNAATYLGKGKVEELSRFIEEKNASLIIFDDELSPSQGKNLEDATGKRVMDRAELILDIFATRARSKEAKMQVELAQLQYMLPRLTRMWAHLESDDRDTASPELGQRQTTVTTSAQARVDQTPRPCSAKARDKALHMPVAHSQS